MHHSYLLWRDWFGTEEMRRIWSEENIINGWLKVESALAMTLAEAGVIPISAAETIQNCSNLEPKTIAEIHDVTSSTRHIIAGFVKYMRKRCKDAGEYYHLGTTSQDILDTGLALLIRESLQVIEREMSALLEIMLSLADRHRHTVMSGRSQGQHALPITFGFKCAIWASELQDHLKRMGELRKRVLVISIGAAMGTQASFVSLMDKNQTMGMARRMAEQLKLECPDIDVHGRVDRFAEMLNAIALVCSFLGKIGLELRDLQRTEVAEITEAWKATFKGSSTMPHKQNPEQAHWLEGLAKIARSNALAMMDVQVQHERDATRTAPEFACIPESFLCLSAALHMAIDILSNIRIDALRMHKNLSITGGLLMSEAVWIGLFQKTGRLAESQRIVKACAETARRGEISFKQALLEHSDIQPSFTEDEIEAMLTPESYLGTVDEQIDAVLRSAGARPKAMAAPYFK